MKRFALEVGMAWCRVTEDLASTLNVAPTLEGLLSVPSHELAKSLAMLQAASWKDFSKLGIQSIFPMAPVVDGITLSRAPFDPLPAAAADIDILVGHTKDEAAAFMKLLTGLKSDPEYFLSLLGFPQVNVS